MTRRRQRALSWKLTFFVSVFCLALVEFAKRFQ
jgi:hypothetical protein